MKLDRLLELAGVELDEASLAKYTEPKANHTKKTGGEDVKKPKEGKGKTTSKSKYAEPKADNKKKTGGEEKKAPEGKLKVPGTGGYADNNDTGAKPGLKSVK